MFIQNLNEVVYKRNGFYNLCIFVILVLLCSTKDKENVVRLGIIAKRI